MKRLAAVWLLIPLLGCASPGFTAEDEAAIRAVLAEWDRLASANDWIATTEYMTEDYVEARPTAVEGRQAARERYEAMSVQYSAMQSTVKKIEGSGDLAYVYSSFEGRYTRDDGSQVSQRGNSLWVMKRTTEGEWRVAGSGWQSRSQVDTSGS